MNTPDADALQARIARYVDDPESGDFDALALDAFAFQYERVEPYRRLCDGRGARPGQVESWRGVPPVPTAAFKSLRITTAGDDEGAGDEEPEIFRSSGTREGEDRRSVHHHPYPDLYRRTVDRAFPAFCPLVAARPPILALVPDREQAPDSSLAFMVDHLVRGHGGDGSAHAFGRRGVDARTLRSWLGARQRDGRPALVLATTFALADAVEALQRFGLRFRLAAGSVVLDTGGSKGRRKEVERGELLAAVQDYLGVPPGQVLGEYGMTELTSQLYTANLVGGPADRYRPPHWVQVRTLDPATLEPAPAGEPGLVAVFDLANLGSAVHLLTEDLGRLHDDGLELLGRAPGAELRGCSLTVEELSSR